MDPLELLPPELWRLIFEKVEEPQDWLNLYRASPTFEEVVGEEERTRALLHQVFPLLREHLIRENETASELLPLRLVSKHWKRTVDTSLELSEGVGDEIVNPLEIGWKYYFGDSQTISRFLCKFDTHPGNPIIGSFVQLFFDDLVGLREETMLEYSCSVRRLLDRFGNQIKKLHVFCSILDSSSVNIFLHEFRSWVQLAPNLEELSVRFLGMEGLNFMRLDDNPILGWNQPLWPSTSKLRSFSFDGFGGPGALQNFGIFFGHYELSDRDYAKRFFDFMKNKFSEYEMWEILPKLVKVELIRQRPGKFLAESVTKIYNREKNTSSELGN